MHPLELVWKHFAKQPSVQIQKRVYVNLRILNFNLNHIKTVVAMSIWEKKES